MCAVLLPKWMEMRHTSTPIAKGDPVRKTGTGPGVREREAENRVAGNQGLNPHNFFKCAAMDGTPNIPFIRLRIEVHNVSDMSLSRYPKQAILSIPQPSEICLLD
jgi:hypothetical protein